MYNTRQFVRESCGPLLEVDKAKDNVRFVHASAVDFFSRVARDELWLMKSDEAIFVANTFNSYCASICLTYLATGYLEFVPADRDV
jgi:hypothetical protein